MNVEFKSLEPFIPSGKDFEGSKKLFQALGFQLVWDEGDYIGFERENCKFILQRYDNEQFAQNLMLSVKVSDLVAYQDFLLEAKITEQFKINLGKISNQPYGKEMNMIDLAGVCWHFIEE